MDLNDTDPAVARALALALMRQAHEYLAASKETVAAGHLSRAIETLRAPGSSGTG